MTDGGGDTSRGSIRVLLVDDDESFLDALHALVDSQPELSVAGAATNGLGAIELADRIAPDAVVIDLHMPLLDGVSAVARLRRDHPHLCLLALTGDPDPSLHDAARSAGADDVLIKNALLDGLMERLSTLGRSL